MKPNKSIALKYTLLDPIKIITES